MNRDGERFSQRGSALAMVVTCALGLSTSVFAQAADSATPAPNGFKLGEGRLHPYFEFDARYDSLTGYFLGTNGSPAPAGDLILQFRPGLKYDLQNSSTLVQFNGNAEYLYYTGLIAQVSNQLSRFQTNVGLETQFNKDGAVEVQLGDNLTRSDRTRNAVVGVGVISLFNEAHLAIPIHPGGGALEVTPKVGWGVEFFEPLLPGNIFGCTSNNDLTCNPARVSEMNYSNLGFGLSAKYKFLPKTAFLLDTAFDYRTYFNNTTGNPPGNVLRVQAGLLGLISPRISLTLLAGYGGDFAGSNVNTVIGQAEFAYTVGDYARVSLGYLRTVQPVPVFGVFGDDRGYLRGRIGFLNNRLSLQGEAGVDYLSYYRNANRNDLLVQFSAGPSFDVTSWFKIGAGYTLSLRSSSGSGTNLVSVNFVRHEAVLNLTFHY